MKLIRKLICSLRGHNARVTHLLSPYSCRLTCDRCKGDWAHNHDARITLRWSEALGEFYRDMGYEPQPVRSEP